MRTVGIATVFSMFLMVAAGANLSAQVDQDARTPVQQALPRPDATLRSMAAPGGIRSKAMRKGQQAQSQPPGAAESAPPPQTQANTTDPSGAEEPHTAAVLWVSSVEAMRSTHGPQLDVIRVRGLSSSDGWEHAELVPMTKGPAADGILDLAFVAEAPSDSTAPTSFPTVEAVFVVEPGHPYKGVRIHSATNRVTLKAFPGYAESAPAPKDCTSCVGKRFVARGEASPSGSQSVDVVREEDLPKGTHVVRGSDGLGRLESDPNRLTLVLDDDGRIVLAVWD